MNGDRRKGTNPFYTVKSTNPFEDDDIDDESFLKPSTSSFLFSKPKSDDNKNPFLRDIELGDADWSMKMEEIQSRTVESTKRSLARLMESELVGSNIAKELSHQKEQLENCHKKVDGINVNLRNSQKHLRRIKSFFGGFKDFLMGVKIKQTKSTNPFDEEESPKSGKTVVGRETQSSIEVNAMSHPAMKIRFGHNEESKPKHPEDVIEENLGQMFNHVVSLKGLAEELGEELEVQNDLIDTLNDKTEEAQISIAKQNKDIVKMLK
uniref:t-SNARE coiled-coil homology domain-containing protein n=1 Tax=Lygus hesperus TaxID=30085 RepID=A0A0K8T5Y3_LYGHE